MEKEQILSAINEKLGNTNFSEKTISDYIDANLPAEGTEPDDAYFNKHVGFLKSLYGNFSADVAKQVNEAKAKLKPAPAQKKEPEAKPEQTNETPIAADTGNTVRVCECGTKNPPNARKCSACGEDISDITPTPDTCEAEQEKGVPFMITSVDGKYAFEIPEGETVIGREHTMKEYLKEKLYVSREHCKITNNGNGLFVENLAKTNYTYLNNEKVTERTKLSDGDELGLGGISRGGYQDKAAYFTVRINKCS